MKRDNHMRMMATKLLWGRLLPSKAVLQLVLASLVLSAAWNGSLQAAQPHATPRAAHPQAVSSQMPNPQTYKPGTPERTLAEFLAAWHGRNFTRMAQFTMLTWKHSDPAPAQSLRKQFAPTSLVSAQIIGPGKDEWSPDLTENVVCLRMSLRYRSYNGLHTQTLSATVVRELRPYIQNRAGTWGVSPEFTVELDK